MKHVVTTLLPDCPMCGKEMIIAGRMDGGHGLHRLRQHWECPACGHEFPEEPGRIELKSTEVTFPIEDLETSEL